jgi:hypothetical protein
LCVEMKCRTCRSAMSRSDMLPPGRLPTVPRYLAWADKSLRNSKAGNSGGTHAVACDAVQTPQPLDNGSIPSSAREARSTYHMALFETISASRPLLLSYHRLATRARLE